MMLSIERDAALVHVTVEMDRELGETQHGTVDLDETHFAGPQHGRVRRDRGRGRATS